MSWSSKPKNPLLLSVQSPVRKRLDVHRPSPVSKPEDFFLFHVSGISPELGSFFKIFLYSRKNETLSVPSNFTLTLFWTQDMTIFCSCCPVRVMGVLLVRVYGHPSKSRVSLFKFLSRRIIGFIQLVSVGQLRTISSVVPTE